MDWWCGAKRKGRKENDLAWKVTAEEVKVRGYNLDFKNPHTVDDAHGDPAELLAKLNEADAQAISLRDLAARGSPPPLTSRAFRSPSAFGDCNRPYSNHLRLFCGAAPPGPLCEAVVTYRHRKRRKLIGSVDLDPPRLQLP